MPRSSSIRGLTATVAVLFAAALAPGAQAASAISPTAFMSGTRIGTIAPTGSLSRGRADATVTLLGNGKVLVAGGYPDMEATASAEIYDPSTGLFAATGAMNEPRAQATATLLANGKVLVAGGVGTSGSLSSAELYDPVSGTFTPTASMHTARDGHTATLLSDGKEVLIAAGNSATETDTSAEVYRVAANSTPASFQAVGDLGTARGATTATLLPNGKVLFAGGASSTSASGVLSSAELYNPGTRAFTPTGSMLNAQAGATATLLGSGKVLVAGGGRYTGAGIEARDSAELYNPASGTFKATGRMTNTRWGAEATLLANGQVLVAGGAEAEGVSNRFDVYDPASGTFKFGGLLLNYRFGGSGVRLTNGKVLLVGGGDNVNGPTASAELYTPATGAPPRAPGKPAVKWAVNKTKRLVTAAVNPVTGVAYTLTAKLGRKTKTGSCKTKGSKIVCTISPGRGKWAFAVTPRSVGGTGPANRKTLKL